MYVLYATAPHTTVNTWIIHPPPVLLRYKSTEDELHAAHIYHATFWGSPHPKFPLSVESSGWMQGGKSAAAALYHHKGTELAPCMCGCVLKKNTSPSVSRHTHENGSRLLLATLGKTWCRGDIRRALFWTIVLEQIHPSVRYLRWKTKSVLVPGPLQTAPHAAGLTSMWRSSGMLDAEKGRGVR